MSNRINLGNIKGATGTTGPQGQPGLNGTNGLTPEIRNGNWWIGLQDLGVQAEANKWYKGSAVPTNQGKDGDLYLRTTTNDVYYKENGAWSIVTNIKGDTALSVQIGTVTTVSPNTPASVTNSGTNTDLVLDFEIPKGEAGGVPTVSTASQIYGTNSNGEQSTYTHSITGGALTIPQRNADGNVQVGLTPTDDWSATSRQYVNNRSMYPSSYTQYNGLGTGLANPVLDQVYFQAPQDSGGYAYLRFNCSQAGQIDFEILSEDNISLGNVTYQLVAGTISTGIIPMAKGSKLVCRLLYATVVWTDVYFNYTKKA